MMVHRELTSHLCFLLVGRSTIIVHKSARGHCEMLCSLQLVHSGSGNCLTSGNHYLEKHPMSNAFAQIFYQEPHVVEVQAQAGRGKERERRGGRQGSNAGHALPDVPASQWARRGLGRQLCRCDPWTGSKEESDLRSIHGRKGVVVPVLVRESQRSFFPSPFSHCSTFTPFTRQVCIHPTHPGSPTPLGSVI